MFAIYVITLIVHTFFNVKHAIIKYVKNIILINNFAQKSVINVQKFKTKDKAVLYVKNIIYKVTLTKNIQQ
jgi:hypothetical protein